MQVELTDDRITEMMLAGNGSCPSMRRFLRPWSDQLKQILSYIQEVQGGFKEGKDKFPLLGTAFC